jgi:hypothetical protein
MIFVMRREEKEAEQEESGAFAVGSGFSKARMPAAMYRLPSRTQSRNLLHDFIWKALITSAHAGDQHGAIPTMKTLTTV